MPILMIKIPKYLIDSGMEDEVTEAARAAEPEIGSIIVKNAEGISIGCKTTGDGSNLQHLTDDYSGVEINIIEEDF